MRFREAPPRLRIAAAIAVVLVGGSTIVGVTAQTLASASNDAYEATIRWTDYGIPHITASDWGGLGYGYGYAAARDYLCMMAEEYATTNGERSRYFGAMNTYSLTSNGQTYTNLQSDLFFTLLKENPDLVDSIADFPRPQIQDAIDGYVAGYNRWLADTPLGERPEQCRDAPWVRAITRDDFVHRANKLNLIASMGFFAPAMVSAVPPLPDVLGGAGADTDARDNDATLDVRGLAAALPTSDALGLGSNGYAFGSEITANGRGMLLGNPHFPWAGPERFHQLHLTIPGEVDVMGMTLLGVPLVLIGFTGEVAWTHTVSTGWRFSIHELALVPGDPTAYVVDGAVEEMTVRSVTVDTGAGEVTKDFYFSRYGPVIHFPVASAGPVSAGLLWTPARAYALNDMNARNDRTAEQFYQWATAESFDEFVADLKGTHGIPWVNTIAASPDGRALYGDVSIVPNFDASKLQECNTPIGRALYAAARLPVFDGSRSACAPTVDPDAAQPGIIPADEMPLIVTNDWLINSNDDAWLPNPAHPLTGYSPMVGPGPSERSGRTRMGYVMAAEHEPSSLTLARLQQSLFADRLYVAETELDAMLPALCTPALAVSNEGRVVDLTEACAALAAWDERASTESSGLPLFELFWLRAPKAWSVPFSASDPVNTPRGFVVADPRVRAALADAVLLMQGADLAMDATAGEARCTQRDGECIPLHGAAHALGSPAMMTIPFKAVEGFLEPVHGNSYIQTVTWDADGTPLAEAVLSYSQSPHADSPHHADQTRLYSAKEWVKLPFAEADVAAGTLETIVLGE